MEIIKYANIYDDDSSTVRWILDGKYKIVHYNFRFLGSVQREQSTFHAYYIPSWFDTWGNHIKDSVPCYDTLLDAVAACHTFDKASGDLANTKRASKCS